jgi:hypothetical protein
MKGWTLLFLLMNLQLASATIMISEVEANPPGSDSGGEWIELYSENNISIQGWKLARSDNKTQNLSGQINGYYVINISTQWITNTQESITLIDENGTIIDHAESINDSANDEKTWQRCGLQWHFTNQSRGIANDCPQTQNSTNQNNTNQTSSNQNSTNNTVNNQTSSINQTINLTNNTISLEIETKERIRANEEFEVKIKADNLVEDAAYDLKLSIIDGEKTITQVYDEEQEEWISSFYYLEGIMKGQSDEITIQMRLDKKYYDTRGEHKIVARLRKSQTSSYTEAKKTIRIREGEDEEVISNESNQRSNLTINISNKTEASRAVKYLNNKPSKSIKTPILYRSRGQEIREYSLYAFAGLCVLIITYLLLKKSNDF